MAISLVHTDLATQYASATSVSVTVDAAVQSNDLIVIHYFTRSTATVPSGYTKYAELETGDGFGTREGFFIKTSDGTEGGTSVTVAQASSGRIEAFHSIYRGSVDTLTVSKTDTYDGNNTSSGMLPSLSEGKAFLAVSQAVSTYTAASVRAADIGPASDAEWGYLNTDTPPDVNANRLWGAYALYSGADTTTIEWADIYQSGGGSYDWGASIITVVEGSTSDTTAPTVSSAATDAAGDTVTVTFDEALDTTNDTAAGEWVINEGGSPVTISSAAIDTGSTTDVVIQLASALSAGTTITAEYSGTSLRDAAGNQVSTFTGQAVTNNTSATAVKGIQVALKQSDGTTAAANLTGLYYHAWDALNPGGASDANGSSETTDASGVLEINIDSFTASIGGEVFLFVYNLDGTEDKDSTTFVGRVPVVDIA